ncbi:MAG: ArnT family glycosyltransferase, partial [Usitatibacter sp.]
MSASRRMFETLTPGRVLGLLVLGFVVIAGSAMLHTSSTFDEIVFLAVGARGIRIGDFSLVIDHPRLPQYLYGLPVYLLGVTYPPEGAWDWMSRYHYARSMLWAMGNNAEKLILAARMVTLAMGTLTVVATYFLSRRHLTAGAALFAAALVAFLPDVLAHSGIAYNDIPLTFFLLVCVYALDAAVRSPTPGRVALAALAFALTVCTKYSGVIVGPILVALITLEAASGRWRDPAWRRSMLLGALIFLAVTYATIAIVYLGDWHLAGFIDGFSESLSNTSVLRYGFLLGDLHLGGTWYFFPVALLLKTPLALHVLMLVALVGAWGASRAGRWRQWLVHGARAPAVGAALFLLALMSASMNVGTRHAMPMMPFVCILVAQGVEPVWARGRTAVRAALAVVFACFVLSGMRHYPYFLSYLSEYVEGRAPYETLVDSSIDWGQGLVALRNYMREHGIETVALGYFGSALPQGYGIRYVPQPSYFELPDVTPGLAPPRYLVVSSTL